MKVKDIGRLKGRKVITIGPNDNISEAVQKLVNSRIGAMPVCDAKGKLVGILSERDILKGLHQYKSNVVNTRVRDLMSKDVAVGVLEDEINAMLKTMTEKGIRHLPVMVGSRVAGMLSIRDIIEEQLHACNNRVQHLNEYISGGYA